MSDVSERSAKLKVSVSVSMYKYPCEKCTVPFWWVMWMKATPPEPDCFADAWPGGPEDYADSGKDFLMPVVVERALAVTVARTLLTRSDLDNRAQQLVGRAASARGASYNANRCPRCSSLADWHYFDHVVIEAAHQQRRLFVAGPIEIPMMDWAALLDDQHSVRGF